MKPICQIHPTERLPIPPYGARQCGHCATMIVTEDFVGRCVIHSWLCEPCTLAVEVVQFVAGGANGTQTVVRWAS